MKIKNLIVILTVLLWLSSCTPPILFDQPQPEGKNNLNCFPKHLRGLYQNKDGTYLEISSNNVTEKNNVAFELPHNELDSSTRFKLHGNILSDIEKNINIHVDLINDTLRGNWQSTDTFFSLNNEHVLKKYKGNYFLNSKQDNGWQVVIMSPSNNKISINYFNAGDQLDAINSVMDVDTIMNADTTVHHYSINPTQKELKNFLKIPNAFKDSDWFEKVN